MNNTPQCGKFYHLSSEGYFFEYLPIERPRIECRLYERGNGSSPIDRVELLATEMTAEKHQRLINRFETGIALDKY